MDITGKTALVTGGATGLGRAVALALGRAGATTVIVHFDSSSDAADSTVAELTAGRTHAVAVQADLGVPEQARELVRRAATVSGGIDILVNNAATRVAIPYEDVDALTEDVWDRVLGVNLLGPFYVSQSAWPFLRLGNGAIVNVASIAGLRAVGSSIPYSVAKAGLIQLTRSLALAFAPEVRVNAIAPGRIDTEGYGKLVGQAAIEQHDRDVIVRTPLARVAKPEDVAQTVLSFVTSDFVTGETLVVDGGRSLLY
jgi:3-oxoacyl-[acyl-carrier protein] reductase